MWKQIPPLTKEEAAEFDRRFKKKAKLLIDENIGKLAEILRELGWKAISAKEAGLSGRSDESLFAYARRRKRILVTNDRGFLDDRRFPFHRYPALVVVPSPSESLASFPDAIGSALSVVGRYCEAFTGDKIAISLHGAWTIKSFVNERGAHWKGRFKFDKRGTAWEWQESDKSGQRHNRKAPF